MLLLVRVPPGLKVMVECRSTSRHMLTWLMDQMDAEKDSIFLAVTKAQDEGTGRVRQAACRSGHLRVDCKGSKQHVDGQPRTVLTPAGGAPGTAAAACWDGATCCQCHLRVDALLLL